MNGQLTPKSPEPSGSDDLMRGLMTLDREELLQVFSDGFCVHCEARLRGRLEKFTVTKKMTEMSVGNSKAEVLPDTGSASADASRLSSSEYSGDSFTKRAQHQEHTPKSLWKTPESTYSLTQKECAYHISPASIRKKHNSIDKSDCDILLNDGICGSSSSSDNGMSEEQKEHIRFSSVGRKKDFVHIERINGRPTNVLQGLELHTKIFNAEEQKKIVEYIYHLQRMGQRGQLRDRTYSEPRKWMRGKGRVTIQFGCCYNYAVDKKGNPPGIIRDEQVDPLPSLFKKMIKRMVRWHVLPKKCVPDSCIVNIYDEGDCIPPHIDHHDFVRPFCTVSFLAECNILFGSNLKVISPGEFEGPVSIPLPVGSVFILNGNGADIAKHCVPGVPAKRISITFRKMDESKLPYTFSPDPELEQIEPLVKTPVKQNQNQHQSPVNGSTPAREELEPVKKMEKDTFLAQKEDFPPLSSMNTMKRLRVNDIRWRK